jgi:predicted NBD/HSP70 family sugar kinase
MDKFVFNQIVKHPRNLDVTYVPMALGNQAFISTVKATSNYEKVTIALVRDLNQVSIHHTIVFNSFLDQEEANTLYIDRFIKTILWLKGGYKILFSGPIQLFEYVKETYHANGQRSFDVEFMSKIYEKPFTVEYILNKDMPDAFELSNPLGRNLDGYRIGFDAGGSDRKVSAVDNGKSIYSEEIVWHPKLQSDPKYHIEGIKDSILRAASKLPRVDAIGVSSAGIYINNKVMAASLFMKVSETDFNSHIKTIFLDIAKEMGDIPIEVANDGDVTALAGAMSLDENNVLGIAMGTSEAAGFVDSEGHITGWLNELAFVPVDYSDRAEIDEWSKDIGCGVKYFSQDAVIKLADKAGIVLDTSLSPAEKLKVVQEMLEKDHDQASRIFETIGMYLGYSLAYYYQFYHMKHCLILGRVTSGKGGVLILKLANEILESHFPEIHRDISIVLPDEHSRRVGQSIAAASLPKIKK